MSVYDVMLRFVRGRRHLGDGKRQRHRVLRHGIVLVTWHQIVVVGGVSVIVPAALTTVRLDRSLELFLGR